MARHEVAIVYKAYDEATAKFGQIGRGAETLSQTLKKAAVYAASYFGAREIVRWARSTLDEYGKQQEAVQNLTDALSLMGKVNVGTIIGMQRFAAEMQRLTKEDDAAVLSMMTVGATIGKMQGEQLQQATKAAIGLSRVLKTDLETAMRLVAKAAQGNVTALSRLGIKFAEGMTAAEKLNVVLALGAKGFKMAEGETQTFRGAIAQMINTTKDWAKAFGFALAPRVVAMSNWIKNLTFDTIKSAFHFTKWVVSIGAAIIIAPKIVKAVTYIVKVIQQLAKAQTILQALSGPAGWATLAAGIAIAATTAVAIDRAFAGMNVTMEEMQQQMADSALQTSGMTKTLNAGLADIDSTPLRKLKSAIVEVAEEPAWKKVADELAELAREVEDFGKGQSELLFDKMMTVGISEQGMEFVRWNLSRKAYLEERQKLNQAIIETEKNLVKELATIGMSESQKRVWELEQLGATRAEIARIKEMGRQLDAIEKRNTGGAGRQGLQALEGQYLTFAPGRTFKTDYQGQAAKAAAEQVKNGKEQKAILHQIYGGISELVRRGRGRTATVEVSAFP
jgi:hypothetical protein